jgi:hypothetical protein
MPFMKRRDAGRVLTFAVTGALLGGVGIGGCHHKHRGPYTNPGPSITTPPGGTDPDGSQPEPEPEPPDHVNEGPVEEPVEEPPVVTSTNPGPQPEPEPVDIEPSTNNVRKVDDAPPKKVVKHVNTARVAEPAPQPKQ